MNTNILHPREEGVLRVPLTPLPHEDPRSKEVFVTTVKTDVDDTTTNLCDTEQ